MGACWPKSAQAKRQTIETPLRSSAVVPAWGSPSGWASPINADVDHQMVQLVGDMLCPFTMRVRIALQHKGVPVVPTWLTADDLNRRKLETICPDGKLPLLQHGNHKLSGSTDAILDYIEKAFQWSTLVPTAIEHNVQQWVMYIQNTFTPLVGQLLYDGNPFIQHDLEPQLDAAFARLDKGMWEHGKEEGPFFFGSQFSLVDVYLIPFLALVDLLTYFRGLEIKSTHSYLLAYTKAMYSFPSYAPVNVDLELLKTAVAKTLVERMPPPIIVMTMLQHRSILWHLGRLVKLANGLVVAKPGAVTGDCKKRVVAIQVRSLWKGYGRLVELMQEHAQMEERVVFPALEVADAGVSAAAIRDHGRDLPVMNGLREDLKGVMAMEQGSTPYREALFAIADRFRTLQAYSVEHYNEEERELLPLLDAAGLGSENQQALVGHCIGVMEASHAHLLPYLLQGLLPHDIQQYLGLMQSSCEDGKANPLVGRISQVLRYADDEFQGVWKVVQERVPALASRLDNAAGA